MDRNCLRQYEPLHKIFTGMQHQVASQFIDKPAQAQSFSREFCAHIYKVRGLDFSCWLAADACTNAERETYTYAIRIIMSLSIKFVLVINFKMPTNFSI